PCTPRYPYTTLFRSFRSPVESLSRCGIRQAVFRSTMAAREGKMRLAHQGINTLPLLHGDGFRQIARLIHVGAFEDGDVIGQQLRSEEHTSELQSREN